MTNKLQIDVTSLIDKIKQQNLLFYPVIIHILSKALSLYGYKNIISAYLSTENTSGAPFLYQSFNHDFDIFFNNYVENCYFNKSTIELPPNSILFSYLSEEDIKDVNVPAVFISPFEQRENRTFLSFYMRDLSVDDNFLGFCQDFCDSF